MLRSVLPERCRLAVILGYWGWRSVTTSAGWLHSLWRYWRAYSTAQQPRVITRSLIEITIRMSSDCNEQQTLYIIHSMLQLNWRQSYYMPHVFWCHLSNCQLLVAGPSMSLVPVFGTCCRRRSRQFSHCRHSVSISRHSSSGNLIPMSFYEAETLLSVGFSDCYFLFVVFFHLTKPRSSSAI